MKLFYLLFIALAVSPLYSCPTCVGKVAPSSPPFFSDEFYQPHHRQKTVYLDAKRSKKGTTVSGLSDKESMPRSIKKSAISG